MLLSDIEIIQMDNSIEDTSEKMIYPFQPYPVRYVDIKTGEPLPKEQQLSQECPEGARRVISYGVTSYGYDVRLKNDPEHLHIVGRERCRVFNPKNPEIGKDTTKAKILTRESGEEYILLLPGECLLGPTMEHFVMPIDTLAVVTGKSTYARAGIIVNVTPIEPGFRGEVVMEVINPTDTTVMIYLGEGIAQFLFHGHNHQCEMTYGSKGGKYQGQTGLQLGKV